MTQGIFAPTPRPHVPFRLFCLPYAGGSSTTYQNWSNLLDQRVELVCVELPGRGARFDEPPVDRLERLADQLAEEWQPWLDRPFCIFGHGNGALIGFEVAQRLQNHGYCPEIFFASAKQAPSRVAERDGLHTMTDAALIAELQARGDMPAEFFENAQLLKLFLPLLRADFALSETYRYGGPEAIAGDLVMLGGKDDNCMGPEDREAWVQEFTGRTRWQQIPGGHFFVEQYPRQVIEVLNQTFGQWLQTAIFA